MHRTTRTATTVATIARKTRRLLIESLENRTLLSTYYISPSGSDSNAGTSAAPFRTLQKGAQVMTPGDVFNVKAGNYAGINISNDSGTAAAPITFKAEPGVLINTAGPSGRDGINVENSSYLVFDGFTVQPDASQGARARHPLRRRRHRRRRPQQPRRHAGAGYAGDFSSFSTNILVEKNEVSGNYDAGIYTSNSAVNATIRNNYVHDLSPAQGMAVGLHFNGDVSQGGVGIVKARPSKAIALRTSPPASRWTARRTPSFATTR